MKSLIKTRWTSLRSNLGSLFSGGLFFVFINSPCKDNKNVNKRMSEGLVVQWSIQFLKSLTSGGLCSNAAQVSSEISLVSQCALIHIQNKKMNTSSTQLSSFA